MRTSFEGIVKSLPKFALLASIGSVVLTGCAEAGNKTVEIERFYQENVSSTVYGYGNVRTDPKVIEDTASGEENRCFDEGAWSIPKGSPIYTDPKDQDINGPWWGVNIKNIVITGGNNCTDDADRVVWVSKKTIN